MRWLRTLECVRNNRGVVDVRNHFKADLTSGRLPRLNNAGHFIAAMVYCRLSKNLHSPDF